MNEGNRTISLQLPLHFLLLALVSSRVTPGLFRVCVWSLGSPCWILAFSSALPSRLHLESIGSVWVSKANLQQTSDPVSQEEKHLPSPYRGCFCPTMRSPSEKPFQRLQEGGKAVGKEDGTVLLRGRYLSGPARETLTGCNFPNQLFSL